MKNFRAMGMRVVAVGGNSNNGGNAGVFYVNANNSSGNRNANIGRQLSLFFTKILSPLSVALAKTQSKPIGAGSDKVPIDSVLNQELVVTGYRIAKTKYCRNGSEQCLTLEVEIDGVKSVIFTGSNVLIDQINKYAKQIPFIATIVKINKYYRLK